MWVDIHSDEAQESKAIRVNGHADSVLLVQSVQTAIKALPPKLQEVAYLLYSGESETGTANKLGISWHTLKKRIKRVRAAFRAQGVTP